MKIEKPVRSLVTNRTFFLFPKMNCAVFAEGVSAGQCHSPATYRLNAHNAVFVAFNLDSNLVFLLILNFLPVVVAHASVPRLV